MEQYKVILSGIFEPELKERFFKKAPTYTQVVIIDPRNTREADLSEHVRDADFLVLYRGSRL